MNNCSKTSVMSLNYKKSLNDMFTILKLGGKVTQATRHLSLMLNGLKNYSIEITINGDNFLIQVF